MDPELSADLGPAIASQLKSDWARAVEYERLQEAIDSRITTIRDLREEIRVLRAEQGKLKTTTEVAVGGLGRAMEECRVGGAEGEEGTESGGNGTGWRGGGVLQKWREYAAWRADWREKGAAPDPRMGLSCRQCGLRDTTENSKAFSGNVRKRYSDLMAGIQRHGRPIFCSTCTDSRRSQEEEADAWVASLRKTTCMDCYQILAAEELSLTQRRKAVVNRRCRACALKRESEGTRGESNGETQGEDSVKTSDEVVGESNPRRE